MKVPLYEDAAARTGVVIAAAGLFLVQTTGNAVFDGIASIGVGVVLLVVAWELPGGHERLPSAHDAPRADSLLVNAEIHLADGPDTNQVEDLLERVTRKVRDEVPEVTQPFIEPHAAGRQAGRR